MNIFDKKKKEPVNPRARLKLYLKVNRVTTAQLAAELYKDQNGEPTRKHMAVATRNLKRWLDGRKVEEPVLNSYDYRHLYSRGYTPDATKFRPFKLAVDRVKAGDNQIHCSQA
jgi:hypothetical protein